MNQRIKPILISRQATIKAAMEKMQTGPRKNPPAPAGIVLVVDKNKKVLGVATDGDIRRALLGGLGINRKISRIMTKNPLCVRMDKTAGEMLRDVYGKIKKRNAPENKFNNIVVLDEEGRAQDVVTPFELWRRGEVRAKTVAVIGLGYVGLTLALTLNEFGIEVYGVDSNKDIVESLRRGRPHFYENGLDPLLKKHINKRLFAQGGLAKSESDIYIVCVSTPVDKNNKLIFRYLKNASKDISRILKQHDLVILRSTVPAGTCRNFVIPILEKESGLKAGRDFFVAFAPERTVEGRALEELRTLPQIIGGYNQQSVDYATHLFQLFVHSIIPVSSLEAAETVKLLNNTFRDVSFAFANEVAQICEKFGLRSHDIIRAANDGYPRDKIPFPSPGVGGACLVKDPFIFAESARRFGVTARMPKLARDINKSMVDFIASKVDEFCSTHRKDSQKIKIFIMGMAFKGHPETSDIRDSTSVDILKNLRQKYKNIYIYDPVVRGRDLNKLEVQVASSPKDGFRGADCVLVLNNHNSYFSLDIYSLAKSMRSPGLIFDGWGIYSSEVFAPLERITYVGL
jgi:UDP-N-acetyl-D-mannosaminuronic acid dehydrogenase